MYSLVECRVFSLRERGGIRPPRMRLAFLGPDVMIEAHKTLKPDSKANRTRKTQHYWKNPTNIDGPSRLSQRMLTHEIQRATAIGIMKDDRANKRHGMLPAEKSPSWRKRRRAGVLVHPGSARINR